MTQPITEAIQIAQRIQERIQNIQKIDVSLLNAHYTTDREDLIHSELADLPELLKNRIAEEFLGYGPLKTLIEDPLVTEIIINHPEHIWYEYDGEFKKLNDRFLSHITYENFVLRLSKWMQGQVTIDKPFLCQHMDHLRIHISGPAVTEGFHLLSIRKHKKSGWILEEFLSRGWANNIEIAKIKNIIHEKTNTLIVGPTGCGKTSVLNALMSEMKSNERVLILGDTNELKVPNSCSAKILTREDSQDILKRIDLSDLLRQALRMRPDRIVIGEIRGQEAKELLMILSTGHAGSLGTLHASNAPEALLRLEMLIQLGSPQWSLEAIRRLIFLSLQNIIVIGFNENRKRVLKGIYKISGLEDFGIIIDQV